jgi:formylglycine-generating enzyme required for sulfatase activity
MHEFIICGEPKVFSKFFSKYQAYRKQATEKLQQKLAEEIPEFDLLYEEDPLRLVEIHKQANAAVALLRLEDPKPVHEFLTVDRDTEALSQFIYRIRGREVSPSLLIKNLDELRVMPAPTDPKKRQQHFYRLYGMILALGEYKLEQLPSADRDRIVKELSAMYAEHPSRTLHSAVGWLLKRWGQDESVRVVAETELGYDATGVREWYVIQVNPPMSFKSLLKGQIKQEESLIDLAAPIYFTMIVYPGGEFKTGDIKPTRRTEKVQGPFAVSDREVTWRQFSAVDDDTHRKGWEAQYQQQLGGRGLSPDDPAFGVNWFEAVNYCRWLTNRKMPGEKNQCYGKRDLFGSTKSLGKGWVSFLNDSEEAWDWPMDPKRGGFRLLTNEEWEYVARGGTETDFSFGTSVGLLDDYAWHSGNSENWFHPVGLLRPSIAGLFDVHGNLLEWVNNTEIGTAFRVARGGGWSTLNLNCGSSPRYGLKPSSRHYDLGFRLALSCPSGIPQTPEADK